MIVFEFFAGLIKIHNIHGAGIAQLQSALPPLSISQLTSFSERWGCRHHSWHSCMVTQQPHSHAQTRREMSLYSCELGRMGSVSRKGQSLPVRKASHLRLEQQGGQNCQSV